MTSSLVGSEMCIRDSNNWEDWGTNATGEMMEQDKLCHLPDLQGRSLMEPCLLYTSDAADDM
eukprot:9858800-Prorocentrum_lima.AAC.1